MLLFDRDKIELCEGDFEIILLYYCRLIFFGIFQSSLCSTEQSTGKAELNRKGQPYLYLHLIFEKLYFNLTFTPSLPTVPVFCIHD